MVHRPKTIDKVYGTLKNHCLMGFVNWLMSIDKAKNMAKA
jgi:hypothetical protein